MAIAVNFNSTYGTLKLGFEQIETLPGQ